MTCRPPIASTRPRRWPNDGSSTAAPAAARSREPSAMPAIDYVKHLARCRPQQGGRRCAGSLRALGASGDQAGQDGAAEAHAQGIGRLAPASRARDLFGSRPGRLRESSRDHDLPARSNRDMTALRAALNLALENGSRHQRPRLANQAAAGQGCRRAARHLPGRRATSRAHRQGTGGSGQLPARPGAAATSARRHGGAEGLRLRCTPGHADDRQGQGRRRSANRSAQGTSDFFAELCADRPAQEPLLARADGTAWNKDAWKKPLKQAAHDAGLPEGTVAYAMRHSAITDLIALHRLDTMTVAQIAGTSLVMIEKNYGHLLREHAQGGAGWAGPSRSATTVIRSLKLAGGWIWNRRRGRASTERPPMRIVASSAPNRRIGFSPTIGPESDTKRGDGSKRASGWQPSRGNTTKQKCLATSEADSDKLLLPRRGTGRASPDISPVCRSGGMRG